MRVTFTLGNSGNNSYLAHDEDLKLEDRVAALANGFKNKKEKRRRLVNVA
jgi:hypothetical protein